MNNKIYIIALLIITQFLSNCSSQRNAVIPYILGIDTENSIYQSIKGNDKNISFYFEHLSKDKYKIHLAKSDNKFLASNRKLFINDKFYPITLDTDYSFYVKSENNYPIISKFEDEDEKKSNVIKIPDISERLKNKSLYLKDKITLNIDWSIYWIIDGNGNLLETNSK